MFAMPMLMSPQAAGGWSPLDLGSKLVQWLSAADLSTLWKTDGARTTNVSADNDSAYIWDDKSGRGNHMIDRGTLVYRTNGTHHWITFGGSPSGMVMEGNPDWDGAAGDLILWLRLRTSDNKFILFGDASGPSPYGWAAEDGSSSTLLRAQFGTPTLEVNDASAGTTRNNLHDNTATGAWVTVSMTGADVSNIGKDLIVGGYNTNVWDFAGDIAEFALTKNTLTAGEESDLRTWLATRGG